MIWMTSRRLRSLAVLLTFAYAACDAAHAAETSEYWDPNWACGKTFVPTARLVRALYAEDVTGYRGDAKTPPFLIANLPPVNYGVVVFVKRPSGWTGIAVEQSEKVQGAFIAKGKGSAAIFSMWSVGGPGAAYTQLRTTDGWATATCGSVTFPDSIPRPQSYLELHDFNAQETGAGALTGSAEIDNGRRTMTRWFKYTTPDGGATWSSAQRLPSKPPAIPGVYAEIEGDVSGLIADLKRAFP